MSEEKALVELKEACDNGLVRAVTLSEELKELERPPPGTYSLNGTLNYPDPPVVLSSKTQFVFSMMENLRPFRTVEPPPANEAELRVQVVNRLDHDLKELESVAESYTKRVEELNTTLARMNKDVKSVSGLVDAARDCERQPEEQMRPNTKALFKRAKEDYKLVANLLFPEDSDEVSHLLSTMESSDDWVYCEDMFSPALMILVKCHIVKRHPTKKGFFKFAYLH